MKIRLLKKLRKTAIKETLMEYTGEHYKIIPKSNSLYQDVKIVWSLEGAIECRNEKIRENIELQIYKLKLKRGIIK